jgi:hypothetical protein
VAKELLSTLKQEKLVLDWRRRQQSKAALRFAIEEIWIDCPKAMQLKFTQRKCEEVQGRQAPPKPYGERALSSHHLREIPSYPEKETDKVGRAVPVIACIW